MKEHMILGIAKEGSDLDDSQHGISWLMIKDPASFALILEMRWM